MAKKIGAGNEPQNYDDNSGRYAKDNGGNSKDDLKFFLPSEEKYKEIKPLISVKTSPVHFAESIKKAKENIDEDRKWRVEAKDASKYGQDKLFVSEGGSCVAVTPTGDIVSVCAIKGDRRGTELINWAVKNGGDRLDAFSGLYYFYSKVGFEPVSWTEFDEEYAPPDWKPEYGKERVIFWKYTGKQNDLRREDFFKNIKPSADYDAAKDERDRSIENGKKL